MQAAYGLVEDGENELLVLVELEAVGRKRRPRRSLGYCFPRIPPAINCDTSERRSC